MPLLRNQQISLEKWNDILSISPYSSAFQTNDYYKLCKKVPGMSPEVFAFEENDKIKALCIVTLLKESGVKGFFSRRAIIFGGPVLQDLGSETFALFLKHIVKQYKRKAIYLEIRNYFDYSQFHDQYIQDNWKWIPYQNIRLSLKEKSVADVLSSMKYNRKREIKLTLSKNVIYREASDINEVKSLYLILKEIYEHKLKLPLPKAEFFKGIFESAIGKVFIVLHDNYIIGGSFCFYLEKKTIYTMYYCGLRDYQKNIFPTHLSILAAAEFAIKNNIEYLDFMGAGLLGTEYGVRNYKLEFGGNLVEEGRYLKINNQLLYMIGWIALKLEKLLKR